MVHADVEEDWALIGAGAYTNYIKEFPNLDWQKYLAGLYPNNEASGTTLVCENGYEAVKCGTKSGAHAGEATTIAYVCP